MSLRKVRNYRAVLCCLGILPLTLNSSAQSINCADSNWKIYNSNFVDEKFLSFGQKPYLLALHEIVQVFILLQKIARNFTKFEIIEQNCYKKEAKENEKNTW